MWLLLLLCQDQRGLFRGAVWVSGWDALAIAASGAVWFAVPKSAFDVFCSSGSTCSHFEYQGECRAIHLVRVWILVDPAETCSEHLMGTRQHVLALRVPG
jgi:hypothetical protein